MTSKVEMWRSITNGHLTTKQIAQLLGQPHGTIVALVESGELPSLGLVPAGGGIGPNWKIAAPVFHDYLERTGQPLPPGLEPINVGHVRERSLFTTGQVALICGVATRTASKWIDSGKIPGAYRIPGSNDRRVPRQSLIAFMRKYGLPLGALEHGGVVLIGLSEHVESAVYDALGETPCFAVQSWVEAGATIERRKPSAIVVDVSAVGREQCLVSIEALRQDARTEGLRIVVLIADDDPTISRWVDAGAKAVYRVGSDVRMIAATAKGVL